MSPLTVKGMGGLASKGAKGILSKVNPLEAIDNIAKHVTDWQKVKQEEQTKRHEISAKRDVLVENIRAERDAFMVVLQANYKERSVVYNELFERLDQSIETGNMEVAQLAMSGIVEQIKSNPMPSFGELRTAIQSNQAIDF